MSTRIISDSTKHIVINQENITITHEVQIVINQSISSIREAARREHRCSMNNYRLCGGDCSTCPWATDGFMVNIDLLPEHNKQIVSHDNPEDTVLNRITLSNIYQYADSIVSNGGEILKLYCEMGFVTEEIASHIGIHRTTVTRRLNHILESLRANSEMFL